MIVGQAVVDGILTGGVYALMAAGLTLTFGVMQVINVAQGALVVLGAYLSYELAQHAQLSTRSMPFRLSGSPEKPFRR